MASFEWSNENIFKLISLRHDPLTEEKFESNRKHAHKIRHLWMDVAKGIDESLTCEAVKNKYNYLLREFRQHHMKAKASGEGAIRWQFYATLKGHLLSDPSVQPQDYIESQSLSGTSSSISTPETTESEGIPIESKEFTPKKRLKKSNSKMDDFIEVYKTSVENRAKFYEQMNFKSNDKFIDLTEDVLELKKNITEIDKKIDTIFEFIKSKK